MEYEIKIIDGHGFASLEDAVKIFVIEKDVAGRRAAISTDGEHLVMQGLDYALEPKGPKQVKPLLKLPNDMFIALTKFIVDYAKANNIKTEDENFMAGKMKAIESHLQDMRTLVFDLPIKNDEKEKDKKPN